MAFLFFSMNSTLNCTLLSETEISCTGLGLFIHETPDHVPLGSREFWMCGRQREREGERERERQREKGET